MFIPVGLIARLVVGSAQGARDEQIADAMNRAGLEHDRANREAAINELWTACTGPNSCLWMVGGLDWSACSIDDVPVLLPPSAQLPPTGYREGADVLGPGPHGLLAVCPGRHTITVRTTRRTISSAITLFPREAFFQRFDAEAGAFARYEPSDEAAIWRRVNAGDVTLLEYSQHIAANRISRGLPKPSWDAIAACKRELEVVKNAVLGNQLDVAANQARRAAIMLDGVPVASFEPITTFVGFHVFELVNRQEHTRAWTLLQAGFTVLPDNPTLLAVQGELQLKAGATEIGTANLQKALVRVDGLDAALADRVKALLAK